MRLSGWLSRRWSHRRANRRPSQVGSVAADLQGSTPDSTVVEVAMEGRWAVLFFLTTSCYGCRPFWEGFGARAAAGSHDRSVILVTPSPETESAKKVAALAPDGVMVLMASEAWHAYGVTAAPWCVVVAGGRVVAEGTAPPTWAEVEAVLGTRR